MTLVEAAGVEQKGDRIRVEKQRVLTATLHVRPGLTLEMDTLQ